MRRVLLEYINKCDEILELKDIAAAKEISQTILSVFSNIPGISDGLSTFGYGGADDYLGDVEKLRDKLRVHRSQLSNTAKTSEKYSKIVVNNQNNNSNTNTNTNTNILDISLMFQQARKEVAENEALSEQEINEILEKINELEDINNEKDHKNKKWFKMRPTMEWLGTKGLATATCILNLITAILAA